MSDLAQSIYDARFAYSGPAQFKPWSELNDDTKAAWYRCAGAALGWTGLRERDLLEANNRYLQRARDAEAELADVRLALDLALAWLAPNEPGDSRAVSNEFVAMYAIQCGLTDNRVECRAIISSALARAKA